MDIETITSGIKIILIKEIKIFFILEEEKINAVITDVS